MVQKSFFACLFIWVLCDVDFKQSVGWCKIYFCYIAETAEQWHFEHNCKNEFFSEKSPDILYERTPQQCYSVADLRGGARDARPHLWTKISSFSCSLREKLVK